LIAAALGHPSTKAPAASSEPATAKAS